MMNIGVHVSFSIVVFSGYTPSSGIAGSYDSFSPTVNLVTTLQCGCINLHSQTVQEGSIFSTPSPAL